MHYSAFTIIFGWEVSFLQVGRIVQPFSLA